MVRLWHQKMQTANFQDNGNFIFTSHNSRYLSTQLLRCEKLTNALFIVKSYSHLLKTERNSSVAKYSIGLQCRVLSIFGPSWFEILSKGVLLFVLFIPALCNKYLLQIGLHFKISYIRGIRLSTYFSSFAIWHCLKELVYKM